MGGSIPKEKYIKICRHVVVTFPSLEEKCYILQEKKKKYFDGVKCRPPKVQKLHMVTEYHYYHCHTHRL